MASRLPDVLWKYVISYLNCYNQQVLGKLGFGIDCNIICFSEFKGCKTHNPDFYNTIDKMSRKINKYNELSCPIYFKNKEQCSFALKIMKKINYTYWLNKYYKCCGGTGISFHKSNGWNMGKFMSITSYIDPIQYIYSYISTSISIPMSTPISIDIQNIYNYYPRRILNFKYSLKSESFLEKKESKKVINKRLKKINRSRSRREKHIFKNKFKNKHRNNKYQKKGRKEKRFRYGA